MSKKNPLGSEEPLSQRTVRYKSGYKHQLVETYECQVLIMPGLTFDSRFISLSEEGLLTVKVGYAWDGPSGPVLDRKSTMRAALVHDALYQMMRQGALDAKKWREPADALFRQMCIEDGVWRWLAAVYYRALRRFGESAASAYSMKEVHEAP